MEKSNDVLSQNVIKGIKLQPSLNADKTNGNMNDVITVLTEKAVNHIRKNETGQALKDILEVDAISDDLKVKPYVAARNDKDIATSVIKALHEKWNVPDKNIEVTVEDGLVTLQGNLHWNFQRKAAYGAIKNLEGVSGIDDKIKIEAEIQNEIGRDIVVKALRQCWILEIGNIKVRMDDKTIFL
ncbi:MAG: BON domain-containing protein, partial [Flavobacterium sp.]